MLFDVNTLFVTLNGQYPICYAGSARNLCSEFGYFDSFVQLIGDLHSGERLSDSSSPNRGTMFKVTLESTHA